MNEKRALVFKLYPGGTLQDKIDSLGVKNKIKVTHDLLHGLAFLHSIGIFHCDLKNDNVLLDIDEKSNTVLEAVITDFGFSVDFSTPGNWFYKNGHRKYQAPELKLIPCGEQLGNQQSAFAADIYSMGLILESLFEEVLPPTHPVFRLVAQMKNIDPCQRGSAKWAASQFDQFSNSSEPVLHWPRSTSSSSTSSSSM